MSMLSFRIAGDGHWSAAFTPLQRTSFPKLKNHFEGPYCRTLKRRKRRAPMPTVI